jgi:hypothetical protein
MGNSNCSGSPQLQCLEISELHSVAKGRVQRMLKMLTNCVSTVFRCRGILLFVGLMSLIPQLPAQDRSCKMQSDRASAAVWGQFPPPSGGITVAFYDDAAGFVGLNHVYAHSQHLTHRWRSFIPWMSSGIVSVFPFGRAIQSPASRMPLFYVSHTAAALDGSEPDAQRVHLVRAASKHDARWFRLPRGGLSSAFTRDLPHAKRFRSGFMSSRVLFTQSNRKGLSITANTL